MEGWWAASYVVLWLLVLVLMVVVVALARQIGTLHLRLGPRGALEMDEEGPQLGEMLPDHRVADADGAMLRFDHGALGKAIRDRHFMGAPGSDGHFAFQLFDGPVETSD